MQAWVVQTHEHIKTINRKGRPGTPADELECVPSSLQTHISQMVHQDSVSLGFYLSKDRAASAYDQVLVQALGLKAQTNFSITNYKHLLSANLHFPFGSGCRIWQDCAEVRRRLWTPLQHTYSCCKPLSPFHIPSSHAITLQVQRTAKRWKRRRSNFTSGMCDWVERCSMMGSYRWDSQRVYC